MRDAGAVAVEREHHDVVRLGGVARPRRDPGATAIAVPTGVGLRRISAITRLLATTTLEPMASL